MERRFYNEKNIEFLKPKFRGNPWGDGLIKIWQS